MGETLRPQGGKGTFLVGRLWPELDRVSEGRASPSVGFEVSKNTGKLAPVLRRLFDVFTQPGRLTQHLTGVPPLRHWTCTISWIAWSMF